MWQASECESSADRVKTTTESAGQRERKSRFDVVDLYEELLSRRAELGHRPVIYVSSERDLECTLIGMFERELSEAAVAEAVPQVESIEELRRRLQ